LDCHWTNGRRSWRRSAGGSFSTRRRRVLLPLRRAPPSNTCHCNAGELLP
jgi:hypothetical protein